MFKVSIIIPYYNNEDTIMKALESVIQQTYKNYEVILINDGSKDSSIDIVNRFISNHGSSAFKHIYQENKGPSTSRNRGINEALGEYVAFLDADDTWEPEKLECQIKIMDDRNMDILGCNYNIRRTVGIRKKYFTRKKIEEISFYKLLFRHYYSTSCTIIRRDALIRAGLFPEGRKYMEDSLVFTKVARSNRAYMINNFLVNIYKLPYGESGLSGNLWEMEKGELHNFKILKSENNNSHKKIGIFLYIIIYLFSILKYILRLIIQETRIKFS